MTAPEPSISSNKSTSSDHSDEPTSQSTLFSGLRLVGLFTFLSRVLGLIRDVGMAALFGLSPLADHFVVAFSIPNLARRLFGEGALSASFLPVLTRELHHAERESVWKLISAVFTLLTIALAILVLMGELGLWAASTYFTNSEDTQTLLSLTAIMLPYLIVICLAAQVSAVLHVLGHFTLPALVPVVLNVCWIGSLWLIAPLFEDHPLQQAYAIACTIVLAGVLQVAILWPKLHSFGYRFRTGWRDVWPRIGEITRSMLPVMLGLSTTLFNTLADRLIAWSFARHLTNPPLEAGAAAALYYAQRLYQFPLGVFGVALGTVLFPRLARHAAQQRLDLLRDDLSLGLRLVITIGLPASVGLMLLSAPLSQTLFEYGEFGATDSARTAGLISAYGVGVWAFCGQLILYRGFYALDDRGTPLKIGLLSVAINLTLNFTLIWPLGGQGLAYGTSISAMIQVVLLLWAIQQRCGRLDWSRLAATVLRAGLATTLMAIVCTITLGLTDSADGIGLRVIRVGAPVLASMVVYYLAAGQLKLDEVQMLLRRRAD